jgi:ATP sulfurylase
MAIQTFGITAGDIQGIVSNLVINASSSPTITQVGDMIEQVSAEVQAESRNVGISTTAIIDSTTPEYQMLKRMVIYKVAGEILISRNRGDENSGKYYIDRFLDLRETIRKRPQVVEDDTQNGPDLASYINQSATNFSADEVYGSGAVADIVFGDSL